MNPQNDDLIRIILADDDEDDRSFFKEALESVKIKTNIVLLNDGVQLMNHLESAETLPDMLFLDLNMPKKNGMQCLKEIREKERLRYLTVAIYSTSASQMDIEEAFVKGANIYIRKPNDFLKLKKILSEVVSVNWQYQTSPLNKENFFMSV